MLTNNDTTYRNIFKATFLLGSLQVYQILIGIIKSKVLAILLGPIGVGIQGLLISTISMVQGFTSMGVSQSAVRDISEAQGTDDQNRISATISVVKKMVWITGLLGLFTMCAFSSVLSRTTFGNNDYTIPFIFLSISLLFDQLTSGFKVILQGMRKLKMLAKATAYGSTLGLLLSLPFYYIFGIKGIVPSLILYSIITFVVTFYFTKKIPINKVRVSFKELPKAGRGMAKMGITLGLNSILASLVAYIIKGYISNVGSVADVGIYTAAAVIMDSYVGMVFTAISTDFYPRLAAVNKDNSKCREICSKQGEIGILIITPLLFSCVLLIPFIIKLLYSSEFIMAKNYIIAASLGMLFRFCSILVSTQFVAKGESRLYIKNEFVAKIYMLLFNILGYHFLGILGLGIAFTTSYLVYCIQVYIIAYKKYEFRFTGKFLVSFAASVLVMMIAIILRVFYGYNYVVIILLSSLIIFFCLKELNKLVGLESLLKK